MVIETTSVVRYIQSIVENPIDSMTSEILVIVNNYTTILVCVRGTSANLPNSTYTISSIGSYNFPRSILVFGTTILFEDDFVINH